MSMPNEGRISLEGNDENLELAAEKNTGMDSDVLFSISLSRREMHELFKELSAVQNDLKAVKRIAEASAEQGE